MTEQLYCAHCGRHIYRTLQEHIGSTGSLHSQVVYRHTHSTRVICDDGTICKDPDTMAAIAEGEADVAAGRVGTLDIPDAMTVAHTECGFCDDGIWLGATCPYCDGTGRVRGVQ